MAILEERQTFSLWGYAALFAGPAFLLALALLIPGIALLPLFIIGIVMLCISLFVANLLYMKTTLTAERLEVSFGYAFVVYRKSFVLSEIRNEGPVTFRPVRDSGGWGIRWGNFDGGSCRFLTARGNRGVLIHSPESAFIIGSQDPDALVQALSASTEPARP